MDLSGNLLSALLRDEGAWAELGRSTRKRIEATVEEALRWETPIAVLPRMSASELVEFYGVEIPADSWVLFAMAGANRDPAIFRDPDRFDIGRSQGDTLSFGRGVKSCPGMHLARRKHGRRRRDLANTDAQAQAAGCRSRSAAAHGLAQPGCLAGEPLTERAARGRVSWQRDSAPASASGPPRSWP